MGTLQFLPNGGNQSLDLTGAFNTLDGGVSQTVTLTTGLTYTISFFVGNMDNRANNYPSDSSVQVLNNGSSLGTFTNNVNTNNQTNWTQFSLNFPASTASNTIEFRNATGASDSFVGLDDVSIEVAGAAAVPEPGTFGLMGLAFAFAGFSFLRRARRRRG